MVEPGECPLCGHENNDECGCWEVIEEYPNEEDAN
jgi:hypothetical protein